MAVVPLFHLLDGAVEEPVLWLGEVAEAGLGLLSAVVLYRRFLGDGLLDPIGFLGYQRVERLCLPLSRLVECTTTRR